MASVLLIHGAGQAGRLYRRLPGFVVRAMVDVPDRAGWLDVVGALTALDLSPLLPRITSPTLVLCGAKDRLNLADARTLAASIAGAELEIVPGAGHLWPMRTPDAFGATVDAYLSR